MRTSRAFVYLVVAGLAACDGDETIGDGGGSAGEGAQHGGTATTGGTGSASGGAGSGGQRNDGGAGGGLGHAYDVEAELAQLPSPTFDSISFPAAPTIHDVVTCTTYECLTENINVPNRRTVVTADATIAMSGDTQITGSDVELEVAGTLDCDVGEGLTYLGATRARLIFTGAGTTDCPIGGGNSPTDIVLWGVVQDSSANVGAENNWFAPVRLAIVHSSFISDRYALFLHNAGAARPVDAIVANSFFKGGATCCSLVRTSNEQRGVWIDSRYQMDDGELAHTFRKHGGGVAGGPDDIYVARNQFVGSGIWITANPAGAIDLSNQVSNIWYLDNDIWPQVGGAVEASLVISDAVGGSTPEQHHGVVATGNEEHTDAPDWLGWPGAPYPGDWTVTGNSGSPNADPPAWVKRGHPTYPPGYTPLR